MYVCVCIYIWATRQVLCACVRWLVSLLSLRTLFLFSKSSSLLYFYCCFVFISSSVGNRDESFYSASRTLHVYGMCACCRFVFPIDGATVVSSNFEYKDFRVICSGLESWAGTHIIVERHTHTRARQTQFSYMRRNGFLVSIWSSNLHNFVYQTFDNILFFLATATISRKSLFLFLFIFWFVWWTVFAIASQLRTQCNIYFSRNQTSHTVSHFSRREVLTESSEINEITSMHTNTSNGISVNRTIAFGLNCMVCVYFEFINCTFAFPKNGWQMVDHSQERGFLFCSVSNEWNYSTTQTRIPATSYSAYCCRVAHVWSNVVCWIVARRTTACATAFSVREMQMDAFNEARRERRPYWKSQYLNRLRIGNDWESTIYSIEDAWKASEMRGKLETVAADFKCTTVCFNVQRSWQFDQKRS